MTTDATIERAIRAALADLRPEGMPPTALRASVMLIPTTLRREPVWRRLARAFAVPVAAAAIAATAILVAVFGLTRAPLVRVPPSGGGAQPPVIGFDPSLEGMGFITATIPSLAIAGVLFIVVGAAVAARTLFSAGASTNRGRATVLLGVVAAIAGVGLTQLDVGLAEGSLRGAPLGYVEEPGSELQDQLVWVATAAPGEPTVGIFSLRNTAAVPVRIEGIVVPSNYDDIVGWQWTALWMPADSPGWSAPPLDEVRPFEPVTLGPGEDLSVYLAGRAGPCAYGPTYQPGGGEESNPGLGGWTPLGPEITVAYSVFSLAGTTMVDIGQTFAEPRINGCTAQQ